jgi:hypothetical protein
MALYALFATCLTFAYLPDWPEADDVPRARYVRPMAGDNALPQYLAENMWSGHASPVLIDGWLSSDRPPLQTGIVLLQRPVAEAIAASTSLFAQISGIVAQASWVPALWTLCAAIRVRRGTLPVVLVAAGMSGFFLLNSAYVWPKMLAGALTLIAIAALEQARRGGWTRRSTVLGMVSACLALLAHTAAAFTLLPAALMYAFGKPRPPARRAAIAIVIAAAMVTPWILYQRLYAPPGNRIMMASIAGEATITGRGFVEAAVGNYRELGMTRALECRWANVKRLLPDLAPGDLASPARRRTTEWNRVFGTLGVLNVAWLLLASRVVRRQRSVDEIRRLYQQVGWSIGFTALVLFGAGEATAHVMAYGAIATLFVLAANELAGLSRRALAALLTIHVAIFVVDWIVLTPPGPASSAIPVASPPLAAIALLAAVAFVVMSARAGSTGDADGAGARTESDAERVYS